MWQSAFVLFESVPTNIFIPALCIARTVSTTTRIADIAVFNDNICRGGELLTVKNAYSIDCLFHFLSHFEHSVIEQNKSTI